MSPIEPSENTQQHSGHTDPIQIEVANSIRALINEARMQAGLQPLKFHTQLTQAAQAQCDDMANNAYFSHEASDNSNAGHRIRRQGYFYQDYAENLVQRWDISPMEAFEQLCASPKHQPTLVDPNYDEIGIAISKASSGEVYYAVILGKR